MSTVDRSFEASDKRVPTFLVQPKQKDDLVREQITKQLFFALAQQEKNFSLEPLKDLSIKQLKDQHLRIEVLWNQLLQNSNVPLDPKTRDAFQSFLQRLQQKVLSCSSGSEMGFIKERLAELQNELFAISLDYRSMLEKQRLALQESLQNLPIPLTNIQLSTALEHYRDCLQQAQHLVQFYENSRQLSPLCRLHLLRFVREDLEILTKALSTFTEEFEECIEATANHIAACVEKEEQPSEYRFETVLQEYFDLHEGLTKMHEFQTMQSGMVTLLESLFKNVTVCSSAKNSDSTVTWRKITEVINERKLESESQRKENFNVLNQIRMEELKFSTLIKFLIEDIGILFKGASRRNRLLIKCMSLDLENEILRKLEELDPQGEAINKALVPLIAQDRQLEAILALTTRAKYALDPLLKDRLQKLRFAVHHQIRLEPLMYAISQGNIRDLLARLPALSGLKPRERDYLINYLLEIAVRFNQLDAVNILLEFPRGLNRFVGSSWFLAVKSRNKELVDAFLRHNVDVNQRDARGNMAIHYVDSPNYHLIVKELISLGTDVNALNLYGENPLSLAVYFNNLSATEELLKCRANPELRTKEGFTPLSIACMKMNFSALQALVGSGAHTHLQSLHRIRPADSHASLLPIAKACWERKDFYTAEFIALKFVGHSWKVIAAATVQGNKFEIGQTGYPPFFTYEILGAWQKFVAEYPEALSKVHVAQLEELLLTNRENSNAVQIIDAISQNKPVLINTGFHEHVVSVFIYSGYLIIANKGSASRRPLEVYRINPKLISESSIGQMLKLKDQSRDNYIEWLKHLPDTFEANTNPLCQLIEQSYPLSPRQETGNCSWESQETAVYGFLVISLLSENPTSAVDALFENAGSIFKKWLQFTQLFAIEEYLRLHQQKEIAEQPINEVIQTIFIRARTDQALWFHDFQPQLAQLEKQYCSMLPSATRAEFKTKLVMTERARVLRPQEITKIKAQSITMPEIMNKVRRSWDSPGEIG